MAFKLIQVAYAHHCFLPRQSQINLTPSYVIYIPLGMYSPKQCQSLFVPYFLIINKGHQKLPYYPAVMVLFVSSYSPPIEEGARWSKFIITGLLFEIKV